MMTVEQVLLNPQTSAWLRTALTAALECDPIDAANDADVLRALLMRRVEIADVDAGGEAAVGARVGEPDAGGFLRAPVRIAVASASSVLVETAGGFPESHVSGDRAAG